MRRIRASPEQAAIELLRQGRVVLSDSNSSRHSFREPKQGTGTDMGIEQLIAVTAFVVLFGAAGYFVWQPVRRLQSWTHDKHHH
jgi:hypothetical protein